MGRDGVGRVRVDDLHCVCRLFVLAARRAGRFVWDLSLSIMVRSMFDVEDSLGNGEVHSLYTAGNERSLDSLP